MIFRLPHCSRLNACRRKVTVNKDSIHKKKWNHNSLFYSASFSFPLGRTLQLSYLLLALITSLSPARFVLISLPFSGCMYVYIYIFNNLIDIRIVERKPDRWKSTRFSWPVVDECDTLRELEFVSCYSIYANRSVSTCHNRMVTRCIVYLPGPSCGSRSTATTEISVRGKQIRSAWKACCEWYAHVASDHEFSPPANYRFRKLLPFSNSTGIVSVRWTRMRRVKFSSLAAG